MLRERTIGFGPLICRRERHGEDASPDQRADKLIEEPDAETDQDQREHNAGDDLRADGFGLDFVGTVHARNGHEGGVTNKTSPTDLPGQTGMGRLAWADWH